MEGHEAGMNAHTDGRQMEVVEQHGQMVVKATARMEVQLQVPAGGQCQGGATATGSGEAAISTATPVAVQAARPVLLAEPELQLQGELGPFNGLLQVTTVNCKKEEKGKVRKNEN